MKVLDAYMSIKPRKVINTMNYSDDMKSISRRNAVKLFGLWGLAGLIAAGKASAFEPQAVNQRKKSLSPIIPIRAIRQKLPIILRR